MIDMTVSNYHLQSTAIHYDGVFLTPNFCRLATNYPDARLIKHIPQAFRFPLICLTLHPLLCILK